MKCSGLLLTHTHYANASRGRLIKHPEDTGFRNRKQRRILWVEEMDSRKFEIPMARRASFRPHRGREVSKYRGTYVTLGH